MQDIHHIVSSVYILIEGSQLSCVLCNWIFNYLRKLAIVKLLNVIDGKECVTTDIQYLTTATKESACFEETQLVQYTFIHTHTHMCVCVIYIYIYIWSFH